MGVMIDYGVGRVSVDSDGFLHFTQDMDFSEPGDGAPKKWSETTRFSCHPMHVASLKTHQHRDRHFVIVSVRDGNGIMVNVSYGEAMEAWSTAKRRWLERLREINLPY